MKNTLLIPVDTTIRNTVECTKLVKRGDTLILQIKIFNNAVLADLTGQSIDLILKKSDGKNIEKTITSIENGTVIAELDIQATNVSGIVQGEVQIYDDESLTSTNTFTFNVDSSLADDVLEKSQDDIQVLTDLKKTIADGNEVIEKYTTNIITVAGTAASVEALVNIKSYIDINLADLIRENDKAVINVSNLERENGEASSNIVTLGELNDNAEILTQLLATLKSENDEAASNISSLNIKNSTAESNISELTTQNSTAASNIENLETQNVRAEANIIALENFGDATELAQDVNALKSEIETARGTEANLDARLDKFDASLSENTQKLTEITTNYNVYASGADTNGFYTIVDYKRADNTTYMHSVWSNANTNGFYQTCTQTYYEADGLTIKGTTKVFSATYDSNGKITSLVEVA